MIKIAFYGKGGIGKSTTVSNVSIALAQKGMKVLQVGCDPKADSTRLLRAGIKRAEDVGQVPESDNAAADVGSMIQKIRSGASFTVMDHIRARVPFSAEDLVREGYAGVLCAEAGGPLPGQGCAGRAVITALEKMEEIGVYDLYKPDAVLYDVLGDVVCGGFAMPMRNGYADHVFILTSGESMSIYAAANIGLALDHFKDRGYADLSGIILNRREVPGEESRVAALALELGTEVTGTLSRSPMVLRAEEEGKCLLQAFPDSEMAQEYRRLADAIAAKTISR
jgi:nitrogenase iron protein NifH